MRKRSRIEDLTDCLKENPDTAFEGEVGIGKPSCILAALETLDGLLPTGQQEGNEANQLAHGYMAEAGSDYLK